MIAPSAAVSVQIQKFEKPMKNLGMFWWAFAIRGGGAVLFTGFLFYAGSFFGTIFFDPIMFVALAVVLGFYILSNGILLGVASGYAAEHQVGIWRLLLAECIFDTALGTYVGLTLLLSRESLGGWRDSTLWEPAAFLPRLRGSFGRTKRIQGYLASQA